MVAGGLTHFGVLAEVRPPPLPCGERACSQHALSVMYASRSCDIVGAGLLVFEQEESSVTLHDDQGKKVIMRERTWINCVASKVMFSLCIHKLVVVAREASQTEHGCLGYALLSGLKEFFGGFSCEECGAGRFTSPTQCKWRWTTFREYRSRINLRSLAAFC